MDWHLQVTLGNDLYGYRAVFQLVVSSGSGYHYLIHVESGTFQPYHHFFLTLTDFLSNRSIIQATGTQGIRPLFDVFQQNSPLGLVAHPIVVCSKRTLAPSTGFPVRASTTFPLNDIWADAHTTMLPNKAVSKHFFFIEII